MAAKTSAAVKNKWNKEHYERIEVVVPKGRKKMIKSQAEECGVSVNTLINRAIDRVVPSDISIFQKFHNERNFFDWYNFEATEEEKRLHDYVSEYSGEYFSDFHFEPDSAVSDFVEMKSSGDGGETWLDDDPYTPPHDIAYFEELVLSSLIYKVQPISPDVAGSYNRVNHTLTISPDSMSKEVILHELIHVYENVIDTLPKFYHDVLLYSLYRSLDNSVPDLHDRIVRHTHLYYGDTITAEGGNHDLLFFLKSLELDIKCGFKLGTVCGYGREED